MSLPWGEVQIPSRGVGILMSGGRTWEPGTNRSGEMPLTMWPCHRPLRWRVELWPGVLSVRILTNLVKDNSLPSY